MNIKFDLQFWYCTKSSLDRIITSLQIDYSRLNAKMIHNIATLLLIIMLPVAAYQVETNVIGLEGE